MCGIQAVTGLPPGQVPTLVGQLASAIPSLAQENPTSQQSSTPLQEGHMAGSEGAAPLCLLVTTCLRSFPATSSTAVPLASAVEKLVRDDLAGHLARHLAATVQVAVAPFYSMPQAQCKL
jgi:hypothetical protein